MARRPPTSPWREALPTRCPGRVLVGLDHAGVGFLTAQALWGHDAAVWWHFDAYAAGEVARVLQANDVSTAAMSVGEDLPGFVPSGEGPLATELATAGDAVTRKDGPFDLIALPFPAGGEALLTRELVEQAHDLLPIGGRLVGATDKDPSWLKGAVETVFGKADVSEVRGGSAVWATRRKERSAWKDHSHVLEVDLPPRPLRFLTRPGVFSYGRLDRGTKALLKVLEVGPKARILDIGCGNGVMGSFATARSTGARAVMVDCNARAVGAARRSIALNGLVGAEAILRRDLEDLPGGPFDLIVANPPYFGDFRIANSFIAAARHHIDRDGRFWLVAKAGEAHREIVGRKFGDSRTEMVGLDTYFVISARP
jgi:16S rRNA (guanine1207-N2)-methyltransferase